MIICFLRASDHGPRWLFQPREKRKEKRYSEMTFVTITFTFSSLDVVFLPAQLWWHSLGSCQHPLVLSPRAGAPAAGKVPHTIPIPHSSIPASAPGESTAPAALPVSAAVRSQHQAALFTCCSAPCLYRPREDSTSLRFKHAARAARRWR